MVAQMRLGDRCWGTPQLASAAPTRRTRSPRVGEPARSRVRARARRLGHARYRRRSMSSSGLSTTLPCPGASRAGSRARSAQALSSARRTVPGEKSQRESGFTFAEVAPTEGGVGITATERAVTEIE